MKIPRWTKEEVAEFIEWHEKRINELNYPDAIKNELRRNRDKWLPVPKD